MRSRHLPARQQIPSCRETDLADTDSDALTSTRPSFPALALVMARGVNAGAIYSLCPTLLALLFCLGNLYLFVDWKRETCLFSTWGYRLVASTVQFSR